MANKYTVSVPRSIFDRTVAFGMTFNQLIVLACVPLVLVLPALFVSFIPLWVILGILALGTIATGVVIVFSPEGQTPNEWFPALVSRWRQPSFYKLHPRDSTMGGLRDIHYLEYVHTHEQIECESENGVDLEQMVEEIDHAEKIQNPFIDENADA